MGNKKVKNVTFTLPVEIVDKLREYVSDDHIPSLNAGVREALEEYIAKNEKLAFRKKMERASKDPMFLKDIEEAMSDFEKADADSARRMDKW